MLELKVNEKFIKFFLPTFMRFKVVNGIVIGLQQTGKTNFVLWLYENIKNYYGEESIFFKHFKLLDYEVEDNLISEMDIEKKDIMFLILDDASFMLSKHNEKTDKMLHDLMVIKHIYPTFQKYYIFTICHYSTSVLPLLRAAHIKAVSSITSAYEIDSLKKYFDLSALWDFYNHFINGKDYYLLCNVLGKTFIFRADKVST